MDPTDDGSNVFVMGLLSDVVLTFVPPEGRPPSGLPRRADAVTVARSSWTDQASPHRVADVARGIWQRHF